MKRCLVFLLTLLMFAGAVIPAAADDGLKVGQTVKMGTYEQDGKASNGPEDIEWLVLDVSGSKALVISKYCLDAARFHGKQTAVTWETCDLRKWLNGTFLEEAFTSAEKARILETEISTPKSAYGNRSGGNDTVDRVFCLSSDEANTYFSSDADRKGTLTKYAEGKTSYNWWWLRSPGGETDAAKAIVNGSGAVTTGGNWVDNNDSVRPAMWISTKKTAEKKKASGTTSSKSAAVQLKVGQTVKMGTYEQDGKTSNGPEDIEWLVLDVSGSKALVISKYCLDAARFHGKQTAVTWETCDLRKWLNGTFLEEAFTSAEKARILETEISTPKSAYGNRSGGNDTVDRVFCLSSDEANTYFSSDADRKGTLTKYAEGKTSYNWWWLRSPGGETDAAKAIVNGGGAVTTGGNWVDNNDSVRPAMWISADGAVCK